MNACEGTDIPNRHFNFILFLVLAILLLFHPLPSAKRPYFQVDLVLILHILLGTSILVTVCNRWAVGKVGSGAS